MKTASAFIVVSVLLSLTGCNSGHDRVGDAPRTESASSVAGWTEVSTSGVALSFPSGWKMVDLATESVEKGVDKAFGNDPKFALMRSQASAAAKQGMIKLFAFDMSTAGSGFGTNCNILIVDEPGQPTLEQIASATVQQLSPMVASGTQSKLEYLSFKAGRTALIRSEIKSNNPSIPALVSLLYLNLKGSKLAAVTFTAPVKDETHIRTISDQSMGTFRFTN
jgi:hypothetical protein